MADRFVPLTGCAYGTAADGELMSGLERKSTRPVSSKAGWDLDDPGVVEDGQEAIDLLESQYIVRGPRSRDLLGESRWSPPVRV